MKPAFHPWLEAAPAAGNPAGACICCRTHHCSQQAAETKSRAPPGENSPSAGTGVAAAAQRCWGFSPEDADGLRDGVWVSQAFYQRGISFMKAFSRPCCTAEAFPGSPGMENSRQRHSGLGRAPARQQEAAQPQPSPRGGFLGAAHFTPRPLGAPGWTRRVGCSMGKLRQKPLTPRSQPGKEGGHRAAPSPSPEAQTEFRLRPGSGWLQSWWLG